MAEWFKDRLRAVEGNITFYVVGLILAYILALLPTEAIKAWLHRPASTVETFLLPLLPIGIVVLVSLVLIKPKTLINVSFTTDDGFHSQQSLTITNHGVDTDFSAECRIESSNRPENFPKGKFKMGWKGGTLLTVHIPRHESEKLLVASFKDIIPHSLFQMSIWKANEESADGYWFARWNAEGQEELPFFRIEVTLIAKGATKPWTQRFLLTPRSRLGPLSLVALEYANE